MLPMKAERVEFQSTGLTHKTSSRPTSTIFPTTARWPRRLAPKGVQWIVLRDPISMSAKQIAQFVSVIGKNARPVQPLYGRRIQTE